MSGSGWQHGALTGFSAEAMTYGSQLRAGQEEVVKHASDIEVCGLSLMLELRQPDNL